jgi:hypothetical protein
MLGGGILYMTYMSGKSCSGILPPLTAEQERLAGHLRKHIAVLSEEIGECNLWRDGTLNATADYIEETFQAMGYAVTSQAYTAQGISVRNLETVLGGTLPTEEIILIGAHYDTARCMPGYIRTPAISSTLWATSHHANWCDNASGPSVATAPFPPRASPRQEG